MLQHDRQLQLIESRLEKKIKPELESMMNNDRETYETFFQNFGLTIKIWCMQIMALIKRYCKTY